MAALARGNADTMLEMSVDLSATSLKISVIPEKVLCLLRSCVEPELIMHATFSLGSSEYILLYLAKQSQK